MVESLITSFLENNMYLIELQYTVYVVSVSDGEIRVLNYSTPIADCINFTGLKF